MVYEIKYAVELPELTVLIIPTAPVVCTVTKTWKRTGQKYFSAYRKCLKMHRQIDGVESDLVGLTMFLDEESNTWNVKEGWGDYVFKEGLKRNQAKNCAIDILSRCLGMYRNQMILLEDPYTVRERRIAHSEPNFAHELQINSDLKFPYGVSLDGEKPV